MKLRYLIILLLVYYSCFLFQDLWLGKDSAMYVLLARSLVQGTGYVDYYCPSPKPHTLYPPGYPFLLSSIIRIFGENLLILRLFSVVLSLLAIILLVKILSKYLGKNKVILICCLFSFNFCFIQFTHTITSETSYLLFSWIAILFCLNGKNLLTSRKLFWGILGCIAAFYTRTVGVSLYVSMLVYLLVKKKYRQSIFVAIAGLAIIPWVVYVLKNSGGYAQAFMLKDAYNPSLGTIKVTDFFLRIVSNLKYYSGKVIADLLFYPYFNEVTFGNFFFPLKILLSLSFCFLFLRGFFVSLKNRAGIVEFYVFFYSFALLFWPYHDPRFLLPIYPFLLNYLLVNFKYKRLLVVKIIMIFILIFPLVLANMESLKNLKANKNIQKPPFLEALSWIKTNTSAGSIIMTVDPGGAYYYTERKGVFWVLNTGPSKAFADIKEKKANYFLLEKDAGLTIKGKKVLLMKDYLSALSNKYPGLLKLVYFTQARPRIDVYKIEYPKDGPY